MKNNKKNNSMFWVKLSNLWTNLCSTSDQIHYFIRFGGKQVEVDGTTPLQPITIHDLRLRCD